jgi:hypothetical protein
MGFGQNSPAQTERSSSRIDKDVEAVKEMTSHIERTTERIIQHARSLGYFESTPDSKLRDSVPIPVITTLADALQAMSRAIDHCSGSLNVFD